MFQPESDHQIDPSDGMCSCGQVLAPPDAADFWEVVSTHIGAAWLGWAADEIERGDLEASAEALRDCAARTETRAYSRAEMFKRMRETAQDRQPEE